MKHNLAEIDLLKNLQDLKCPISAYLVKPQNVIILKNCTYYFFQVTRVAFQFFLFSNTPEHSIDYTCNKF